MKIEYDDDSFDAMQLKLSEELVESIHGHLKDLELDTDRLEELVGKIAFSVSCIIDGSQSIELDNKPVKPVLGFFKTEEPPVINIDYGSWMHEYVHGVVFDLFHPEDE